MSLEKLWMRRAQSRSHFAATHLFLQVWSGRENRLGKTEPEIQGVYCRTPALDSFQYEDYEHVKHWYICRFVGPLDVDLAYETSGITSRAPSNCDACVFVWKAFAAWLDDNDIVTKIRTASIDVIGRKDFKLGRIL